MTCSGDLWQRDSPMSWCQETRSHWCWLGWAATLMFSRYLHLHHTGQPPPARQNTLLHHIHLSSLWLFMYFVPYDLYVGDPISAIVKLKTSWRFLYSSTTNDKCILRCCKSAGSSLAGEVGCYGGGWLRLQEAAAMGTWTHEYVATLPPLNTHYTAC